MVKARVLYKEVLKSVEVLKTCSIEKVIRHLANKLEIENDVLNENAIDANFKRRIERILFKLEQDKEIAKFYKDIDGNIISLNKAKKTLNKRVYYKSRDIAFPNDELLRDIGINFKVCECSTIDWACKKMNTEQISKNNHFTLLFVNDQHYAVSLSAPAEDLPLQFVFSHDVGMPEKLSREVSITRKREFNYRTSYVNIQNDSYDMSKDFKGFILVDISIKEIKVTNTLAKDILIFPEWWFIDNIESNEVKMDKLEPNPKTILPNKTIILNNVSPIYFDLYGYQFVIYPS